MFGILFRKNLKNIIYKVYYMVKYICEKCNKTFDRKSNYNTHINKKFSCKKTIDNKKDVIIEKNT